MYLRKVKSRGKIYYQLMNNNDSFYKTIGSVDKIDKIFSFYNKFSHTVSQLIQLGLVDESTGVLNRLLTEKLTLSDNQRSRREQK